MKQQPSPTIHSHARTVDGIGVQLRSDPRGVIEAPERDRALISIHVGAAVRISCRRAGVNHSGSAVHGDIDIIPINTAARWEIHDRNDTALLIGLPISLLNAAAEECGFDPKRVEIRNCFQVRDQQLEKIGWAMKSEIELGSPSGRLFMDGLSLSPLQRV
jgi:AraC family transcriptional regulator